MGAGSSTCRANSTNELPLFNTITGFNLDAVHMCIQADNALTVVNIDHIAAEKKVTSIDDSTVSSGFDRSTSDSRDIQAVVGSTFLLVEKTA